MNFYETLQISQTASAAVVRAAYVALSEKGERKDQIDDAYFVLSDLGRRNAYDAHMSARTTQPFIASASAKTAPLSVAPSEEKDKPDESFWDHPATRICTNVVKTMLL